MKKRQPSLQEKSFNAVAAGLSGLFRLIFRRSFGAVHKPKVNNEHYWWRWQKIEQIYTKGGEVNNAYSVQEADKLVDNLLKELRVSGATMGERMIALEGRFNPGIYHKFWEAHKLRNRIAHEHIEIAPKQATETLAVYKRVLGELLK